MPKRGGGFHRTEADSGRLLPDGTYEPKSFARNSADQPLIFAVIANGLADGIDLASQRRVRHGAPPPDRLDQIVLADNALPIADEVDQDIETQRPDRNQFGSPL